jgi:hypothetical protein
MFRAARPTSSGGCFGGGGGSGGAAAVVSRLLGRGKALKVLVLGFYGRHNLGDESYLLSLTAAFGSRARLTFVCVDDAQLLRVDPGAHDLVVVGGGDVVCPYFMDKVSALLADHAGPVFAVSVGVPFAADAHRLRLFDHVFARSATDHALAVAELGERNVTRVPDACALLPLPLPRPPSGSGSGKAKGRQPGRVRVAVCMAQPLFHGNARAPELVAALADALARMCACRHERDGARVELELLPFNTNRAQPCECDLLVNAALADALRLRLPRLAGAGAFASVVARGEQSVGGMLQLLAAADLVVAARFHAVAFSMLVGTPFVACYVSSKVGKLLLDAGCLDRSLEMPRDARCLPTALDADALLRCMLDPARAGLPGGGAEAYAACRAPEDAHRSLLERRAAPRTLERALAAVRDMLGRHLLGRPFGEGEGEGEGFDALLRRRAALARGGPAAMAAARVVAFAVTGSTQSPCCWGLHENMQKGDFCLLEAIEFVHRDALRAAQRAPSSGSSSSYCPAVPGAPRRLLVDLSYMEQDSFRGCHRAGWAYAVGALMKLDGPSVGRRGRLLLDTYVDRTFLWGREPLQLAGAIPYRAPWAGFVHHTFDTSHSDHNCAAMFAEPAFIASLAHCRGLIALSRALAAQLEAALRAAGHARVPVRALAHPTEPVPADAEFTPARFAANARRRVVQVGAWLRDPYAIYELPVPDPGAPGNPLRIRKAALRGKDMDGYFAPPGLLPRLEAACGCGDSGSGSGAGDSGSGASSMCRPAAGALNRYCAGMLRRLARDHASVEQLETLDDAAYDALLSQNVVFLRLVDCSAVNTIIECIARATPVFVNRLPAVEEALGADYPGFYTSLAHAAELVCDARAIARAHAHLRRLDRSALSLDAFVNGVQACVDHFTLESTDCCKPEPPCR